MTKTKAGVLSVACVVLAACLSSRHGDAEQGGPRMAMSTEHGNPDELPDGPGGDQGPGMGNSPGNVLDGSCAYVAWPRPDAPRRGYSCQRSEFDAAWQCDCDGQAQAPRIVDGQRCEEVLRQACGVGAQERSYCRHAGGGLCWPSSEAPDAWDCGCGDERDAATLELGAQRDERCEDAAFRHCASSCVDDFGGCAPHAESPAFDCSCDYYAAERIIAAERCEQAVMACDPGQGAAVYEQGLSCNSYAGYCDIDVSEARCACLDGTAETRPASELAERSDEVCHDLLHALCGDGLAQREPYSCSLEKDQGRHCTASGAFGSEVFSCTCLSENACNEEYDIYQGSHSGEDCEAALAACSVEDDLSSRQEAPQCTPSVERQSCERELDAQRRCYASNGAPPAQGSFFCQCYTQIDEGPETDIWDTEIEASDCEAALDACVAQDAAR